MALRRGESNAVRTATIPSRTAGVNMGVLTEEGRGAVVPLAVSTLGLLERCQHEIEILIGIAIEAERIKAQGLEVRRALAKREWSQVERGLSELLEQWSEPLRTHALKVASRDERLHPLPQLISQVKAAIEQVEATMNEKVPQERVPDVARAVEATVKPITLAISILAERLMARVRRNLNDLENELVVLRRAADEQEAPSGLGRGAATVNQRPSRWRPATAEQSRDTRVDRRN